MNILVTGTAGFIGMSLARHLLERGHRVVGLDNFNDYYDVSLKRARHALLEKIPGYTGHEMDLCDAEGLNRLFAETPFDAVCNLAAQAGVRYSLQNPMAYIHSNLEGFANILEACRRHNIPRLVYASSSSVYGGNTKLPFSETDPVDHPVSLYAATKKSNELMAHAYSHLFGFQTVGLRFFTVYGPWGRPDMAYWLFTDALAHGRPIKVFNYGKMRRDFTYIDDIVSGVTSCLEAPREALGPYQVFNIGHNHPEDLMEVIRILADTLGVEPKMEMMPMQPGDVPATYADIDALSAKFGYRPTTPISVGLPNFVKWYKNWTKK